MKINCEHARNLQVISGGAKLECAIGVLKGKFGSLFCEGCKRRTEIIKGGPAVVGVPSPAEGRMISAEEAKRIVKAGGCCGSPANNKA